MVCSQLENIEKQQEKRNRCLKFHFICTRASGFFTAVYSLFTWPEVASQLSMFDNERPIRKKKIINMEFILF